MKKEYPRLHAIASVKGLIVETCEGMGTEESPCRQGLYFAAESEDGNYKIYRIIKEEDEQF